MRQAFCTQRINGRRCGGLLKRGRISEPVIHEDGAPILSQKVNHYRCALCGRRYPVVTVKKFVLDADDPQPMISEYSQDSARDPYREIG